MPALIAFRPSNVMAPRFQPMLAGTIYSAIVTWNLSAQRWYLNVYAGDGTWVLTTAIAETPQGEAIASMTYDAHQGVMICTLVNPHYRPVGQIVQYTITGMQPGTLNARYDCLMIDAARFSFPVAADPGQVVTLGTANRLFDLMSGRVKGAALVYRNRNFEVWP